MVDLYAINIGDAMPAGAVHRRVAGDWMDQGYIANTGRGRRLDIVVVGDRGYVPNAYGYLYDDGRFVTADLNIDGAIPLGGGWTFLPDDGEMARIGLA